MQLLALVSAVNMSTSESPATAPAVGVTVSDDGTKLGMAESLMSLLRVSARYWKLLVLVDPYPEAMALIL